MIVSPEDRDTRDRHKPREMYEHGEQEMSDEVYGEQVLPALRGARV